MVSYFPLYRQAVRAVALAAALLLLSGCSAGVPARPADSDLLPFSSEEASVPASLPESTEPHSPPEEEAPSVQDPAGTPCSFREPVSSLSLFTGQDGAIRLFRDETWLEQRLEQQTVLHRTDSIDGTASALLTSRGGLWMVRDRELLPLDNGTNFFSLSADGSALIRTDQAGILLYHCFATGQHTSISAAVRCAAISPDGRCVAYNTANPDGSTSAWLWIDGTARLLGEELIPFALSNDAQLIYALSTQDSLLYILDDTGAPTGPALPMDGSREVFLSSDHSQILFCSLRQWYIRCGGNEAVPVTEAPLATPVLPRNASVNSSLLPPFTVSTLPASSLWGVFFLDQDSNLLYLEPERTAVPVASGVDGDSLWVSPDADTLFYLWEGTLFRTQRCCIGSPTILAGEITRFLPTSDLTGIYCLDTQNTLWYLEDFHEPRVIRENAADFSLTSDDYCLFLTPSQEDGLLLWATRPGSEALALGSQVVLVHTGPAASFYISLEEEQYRCHLARSGTDFIPLGERETGTE